MSKQRIRLLTLAGVVALALAACAAPASNSPQAAQAPIVANPANTSADPNDPGALVDARYTAVAAQATADEAGRLIARATMAAQATRDALVLGMTATGGALQVAQAQAAATGTAQAMVVQAGQTARADQANATATSLANAATSSALNLQGTRQADQLAQDRTTTARDNRTADYLALIGPITLTIGGLALIVLAWYAATRYIDATSARRAVIETRSGTIVLESGPGGLQARVLPRATPAGLLPAGFEDSDYFETQATTAPAIPYNVNGKPAGELPGIARPDDPARRLALKLLRAAMLANGPASDHIPTAPALGWGGGAWQRAIETIRPYVKTKQGKNGGTRLTGDEYANLLSLYTAIGSHHARVIVPTEPAPGASTYRPTPAGVEIFTP